MSPLGKAKGLAIMIGKPSDDEEDAGMDKDTLLSELAAAVTEGDGEGAAQAIAAYVDACMAKGE